MTSFGRYEILQVLGEGASAVVTRARDTQFEREVALKILKPGMAVDPAAFARFAQEAQTASKLFHPHIATVLDMGEVQGRFYIAMRYVAGKSLDKVLQQYGPLPWEVILKLAQQIGEALDYAHQQGFLHRDVKPANILCAQDGSFVLTDFGLTRAMMSSGVVSVSGSVVGTPYYIAPEIWKGEPASPASDQYSFACALYEAMTGQVLFPGETPAAVMTRHVLNPPEFTPQWPEKIPIAVREVLDRALEKTPAKRHANLSELTTALKRAAAEPAAVKTVPATAAAGDPLFAAVPTAELVPDVPPARPAPQQTAAPHEIPARATPRRQPAPPSNTKRKSPVGLILGAGLGLVALCLIFFAVGRPLISNSLKGAAAQSGTVPSPILTAAGLPTAQPPLTAAEITATPPIIENQPAVQQPTQAPEIPPTPTRALLITQDPNPELPLPFSDNFAQGVNPPWRIIGGKPVVNDGALLAAKDALVLEIGNTQLKNYTLEMDILSVNTAFCSWGSTRDPLTIGVSPRLRIAVSLSGFTWQAFDGKQWNEIARTATDRKVCGRIRLVVNEANYKVFVDGQLANEMVYEPAEGPLVIQLKEDVRIKNLTIQ